MCQRKLAGFENRTIIKLPNGAIQPRIHAETQFPSLSEIELPREYAAEMHLLFKVGQFTLTAERNRAPSKAKIRKYGHLKHVRFVPFR